MNIIDTVFSGRMFAFVVFIHLVSSVVAKRSSGKNVSEMTYFVSVGRKTLAPSQSGLCAAVSSLCVCLCVCPDNKF